MVGATASPSRRVLDALRDAKARLGVTWADVLALAPHPIATPERQEGAPLDPPCGAWAILCDALSVDLEATAGDSAWARACRDAVTPPERAGGAARAHQAQALAGWRRARRALRDAAAPRYVNRRHQLTADLAATSDVARGVCGRYVAALFTLALPLSPSHTLHRHLLGLVDRKAHEITPCPILQAAMR
jgi:hypothetical protein